MIFGMMPYFEMPNTVNAASNIVGTFEGQDSDVFSALGFDTAKLPEGYDAETTDNPTGRDKSVGTQVYELLLSSKNGTIIHGHDNNNLPATGFSEGKGYPSHTYIMSSVAAGDFDGDGYRELIATGQDLDELKKYKGSSTHSSSAEYNCSRR